jgi:hypothetical protein
VHSASERALSQLSPERALTALGDGVAIGRTDNLAFSFAIGQRNGVASGGGAPMAGEDYYRGDQLAGITAPDLSKQCEFAEHIVRARGKRTAFTSVSLERNAIEVFGECQYVLLRVPLDRDKHRLVEHAELIRHLEETARNRDKDERLTALQAVRYARKRREGLISWNFQVDGVERKNLITWARQNVQAYFKRC